MAKKWSEVTASSEFQALPIDKQELARGQYFDSVIAPNVPQDQLSAVKQHFDADTAINQSQRLQASFDRKKGFIGDVTGAVDNRSNNLVNSFSEVEQGQKTYPELAGDMVGNATGLLNDVAGSALSSGFNALPNFIQKPIRSGAASVYNTVMDSPVGGLAHEAATQWNNVEKEYPRTTGQIKNAFNTGAYLLPGLSKSGEAAVMGASSVAKDAFAGTVGKAADIASNVAGKLVPTVPEQTFPLAQRAIELNVPLKVSQVSNSKPLKVANAVTEQLPFSGSQAFTDSQNAAWQTGVGRELGLKTSDLGPQTIRDFKKTNSQNFNDVFKGTEISFSGDFDDALNSITDIAKNSIDPNLQSIIEKNSNYLKEAFKGGVIPGEKVNSVRSELLKRQSGATGSVKSYLSDMIDVIDDHVADSLPEKNLNLLSKTRREYRNFKTIQPLLKKSTDGNISPASLMQKVSSSKYIDASQIPVGEDGLVDLARIGQQFLKQQVSDSGSAQRLAYTKGFVGAGTGGAALANLPLTAAGLGASRGVQALNNSQKILLKSLSKSEQRLALSRAFENKKLKGK